MIFNFTTNGNGAFLTERLQGIIEDPATLGVLLALVYTIASFAQLVVGRLIDNFRSSGSTCRSSPCRCRCSSWPRGRAAGRSTR